MKLVIGGYGQNKRGYVERTFPGATVWDEFHLFVKEQLAAGVSAEDIRQQVVERVAGCDSGSCSTGRSAGAQASVGSELVIIADELGCGIVPMDAADRQWRETTGRLLCFVAEQADEVYRLVCGIPQRLK